jgi:lia operon protein LiaI
MRINGSKGLAVVLIGIGVLVILGKFTPLLGHLFGLLFGLIISVAMIALGYYGIRRGNAFFGWIFLVIGVLTLLSKLAWLFIPILGIGLVLYGVSVFKNGRGRS